MDAPETVTDAVESLRLAGFGGEFGLDTATVRCGVCDHEHAPSQLAVHHVFRFEGDSDPADEAIVLGLECPDCGARGTLVSAYGPQASPALLAIRDAPDARDEP